MHEAQLHEQNSFITLTYRTEELPKNNSLNYTEYQSFMKRLRKISKVRFYMCGEYGEENGRPHYHACIFGEAFLKDRYAWKKTKAGYQLYRSPTLEKLWTKGDSNIGDLTFDSANYVAGYVTKKLTGDGNDKYYNIYDVETGEIHERMKEFGRMSLKPGIGHNWLRLYWNETKEGKVIVNGKEATAPKYYRKYFKNSIHGDTITDEMQKQFKPEDNTDERLKIREQVANARTTQFKRNNGE